MKNALKNTAISVVFGLGTMAATQLASAAEYNPWFEREDGAMVHDASGAICPSIVAEYSRADLEGAADHGYCAYENDTTGEAFSVQFYEGGSASPDAELQRTLDHFEDDTAIISASFSVGCEGQLAAAKTGAASIADIAATTNDFEIAEDLRCAVLETSSGQWVISIQSADDWYISTVSSSPVKSEDTLKTMVSASADFHARQYAQPAV